MRNISAHQVSRRHFLAVAGAAAAGMWLSPRLTFAGDESPVTIIRNAPKTATIDVTRLRGNVSVLEGSGGNIAVLTGRDGKVMIDAGIAVSRPQLATALAAIGPEPVTQLINTHWHFDHANGNEWLHELGPEILAHENTRKHLSTM